ncbi:MAG: hypothetical protein ACOYOF_06315, partial [Verrucomicrobiaceae bacterium]
VQFVKSQLTMNTRKQLSAGKTKNPAGTFQQGLMKTDRGSLFAYSHRGHIKNLAAIVVAT